MQKRFFIPVYQFPGWLRAAEIYSSKCYYSEITVTRPKSRCWQIYRSSKSCKREFIPASSSFWWLPAFLDLCLHHSSLCPHLHIASSLCVCSLSLIRTLASGFRITWVSQDHLGSRFLPQLHLHRLLFSVRSHFQVLEHGCNFQGATIKPITESVGKKTGRKYSQGAVEQVLEWQNYRGFFPLQVCNFYKVTVLLY